MLGRPLPSFSTLYLKVILTISHYRGGLFLGIIMAIFEQSTITSFVLSLYSTLLLLLLLHTVIYFTLYKVFYRFVKRNKIINREIVVPIQLHLELCTSNSISFCNVLYPTLRYETN